MSRVSKLALFSSSLIAVTSLLSVGCKARSYNAGGNTAAAGGGGDVAGADYAMAYNALQIWEGKTSEQKTSFPSDYQTKTGTHAADGVFYVSSSDFWKEAPPQPRGRGPRTLIAQPTDGAFMEPKGADRDAQNTVVYPDRGRGVLKLRFSERTLENVTHEQAVQKCAAMGMRLPTARELFDFCSIGEDKGQYSYWDSRCRPTKPTKRPRNTDDPRFESPDMTTTWTASVVASNLAVVWWVNAYDGLYANDEDSIYRTEKDPFPGTRTCQSCTNKVQYRCVGPAK